MTQQPQQRKVYIEHLYIARILANVSFLPASWAGLSGTERPTARGSRARIAGMYTGLSYQDVSCHRLHVNA